MVCNGYNSDCRMGLPVSGLSSCDNSNGEALDEIICSILYRSLCIQKRRRECNFVSQLPSELYSRTAKRRGELNRLCRGSFKKVVSVKRFVGILYPEYRRSKIILMLNLGVILHVDRLLVTRITSSLDLHLSLLVVQRCDRFQLRTTGSTQLRP